MQLFKISLFLWALVSAAAASTLFGQSPAKNSPADYGGHWVLNTGESKGLPPFYSNVKTHALEISQATNSLAVTVLIKNTDGGEVKLDHRLDGSNVMSTTLIRGPQGDMQVPTKLNAVVKEGGDLHIILSRELEMNCEKQNAVTSEDWHLTTDGKSILIHRIDETPRGKIDAEMVFVRQ